MRELLNKYFGRDVSDRIISVSRAFFGLYSVLSCASKRSGRSDVLYPPTTCASPVYAATFAGLNPVFVDISDRDYLIDEEATLSYIEVHRNELLAVVYIYTFGHTSDAVLRIRRKCDEYGILLIEDAAQAFGGTVQGTPVGLIGHYAILSFGYSKQVDAGMGGLLLNNDGIVSNAELRGAIDGIELARVDPGLATAYKRDFYDFRLKALADETKFSLYADFPTRFRDLYFTDARPDWNRVETRLREFLADDGVSKRNSIARRYAERLSTGEFRGRLVVPAVRDGFSVYRYTFMLLGEDGTLSLSEHLRSGGINCSNLYLPVNRFYGDTGCSRALDFARRCVNLWVEPSVATDDYLNRTIELMSSYYS